jgi:hypothetical protein
MFIFLVVSVPQFHNSTNLGCNKHQDDETAQSLFICMKKEQLKSRRISSKATTVYDIVKANILVFKDNFSHDI